MHEVWEIIGSFADCLQLKQLDYIFEKLKTIPVHSYDTQYLEFLYKITDRGIDLNFGVDQVIISPSFFFFSLSYLTGIKKVVRS